MALLHRLKMLRHEIQQNVKMVKNSQLMQHETHIKLLYASI